MANCDTCPKASVPLIVHESDMARLERNNKRLVIIVVLLLLVCFVTNLAWVVYERQYETVRVEQDSGDRGVNNFIGNDGDIYNGETDRNISQTQDP